MEYVNLMIWLGAKGFPPFTKQSSQEILLNNLGFTILAEANMPQWKWMSLGAHPETQLLTICTMNCGIPGVEVWLCEMLMSLLVQVPIYVITIKTKLNKVKKGAQK